MNILHFNNPSNILPATYQYDGREYALANFAFGSNSKEGFERERRFWEFNGHQTLFLEYADSIGLYIWPDLAPLPIEIRYKGQTQQEIKYNYL